MTGADSSSYVGSSHNADSVAHLWRLSWRADPTARAIADRHYNRQAVGAAQFVPPGRCLVLLSDSPALWVTSWPMAEYVQHAWAGAWVCSCFRNEGPALSSDLIRQAVSVTRWRWALNTRGMVTFVDPGKVRHKRDPGRCFIRAGFHPDGATQGGLLAFVMDAADMPAAAEPAPRDGALMAI
jgi:hypothetical protein